MAVPRAAVIAVALASCAFRAPGGSARAACYDWYDFIAERAAECRIDVRRDMLDEQRERCSRIVSGDADGIEACISSYSELSCAGLYKSRGDVECVALSMAVRL